MINTPERGQRERAGLDEEGYVGANFIYCRHLPGTGWRRGVPENAGRARGRAPGLEQEVRGYTRLSMTRPPAMEGRHA
eukprot:7546558-Alexandrium_andersonii.AAC.1